MISKATLLEAVQDSLTTVPGKTTAIKWLQDLPGGDINHAALIGNGKGKWFLKYKQDAPDGMFAAEARALDEIAQLNCIRVPSPIAFGSDGNTAWLVLEYLQLRSRGPYELLGEQLAALHMTKFDHFGWVRDNFIGTTKQVNGKCSDWSEFWRDYRLGPQISLVKTAGYGARIVDQGERLLQDLDSLLADHKPAASLLHGDLWAGNLAFTQHGQPVIFDPASYFGDRETDIAMTELFGGFGLEFYAAYNAHTPLADGYHLRRDLYNLYHMLNHLNLFGGSYLSRCENIIDQLLAQLR